jgi:hypothetical protein
MQRGACALNTRAPSRHFRSRACGAGELGATQKKLIRPDRPRFFFLICRSRAVSLDSLIRHTGEAMGIKLQGAGGGETGEPVKLQGFAGLHTRPARPPEAKLRRTAGGLHFFGGGLR